MTDDRLCLLQVHAHPDDEASKGAGTNARYAAEGVHTVLVTCTDGAEGDILNPAADTPEVRADIRAVRLAELEESIRILGYGSTYMLGYRDSGHEGHRGEQPTPSRSPWRRSTRRSRSSCGSSGPSGPR